MSTEFEYRGIPNEGSIQAHKASVDIVSSLDLQRTYNDLKAANAPIIYSYQQLPQRNGYILYHEESNINELIISSDKKEITVSYPDSQLRNGEVIFSAAYPLIESQLQEQGYLTCHAACVVIEGQGILLLGPSGSGKTSTVLELCQKYGAKLMGNNSCIIGLDNSLKIVEGTKSLTLRYSSVVQDHPELTHLFGTDEKDPWRKKISLSPEEIGIQTQEETVNIESAYLLHVDNTLSQLYKDKASALDDKLYLYDNFSRIIRLTGMTPLVGDKYDFSSYFPSLDKQQYYEGRVALIGHLQDKLSMDRLTGPLDRVVGFIVEQAKEKAK